MLPLTAGLLVALLTGFCALLALWPATPGRSVSSYLLAFFLSCGFAFGISSVTFFCLRIVDQQQHVIVLDLILGAAIAGALFVRRTSRAEQTKIPVLPPYRPLWERVILSISPAAFSVAFAACAYLLVSLSIAEPHGGWDAWAIWNARARFLFRAGNQWRDAFSSVLLWSHVDYPPLLPAANAHLWSYLGRDDVRGPIAIALTLTFATIGLAVCSLCRLRSWSNGLLAGLVLSSTKLFVERGASQYADIPLSFFYLATVVLVFLHDSGGELGYLALAGTMAGFAAWTKNEGLVFLLCVIAARALVMLCRKEARILKTLLIFGLGAAPVLAVLAFFKMHLAGPGDIFRGGLASFGQLASGSRYLAILQALRLQVLTLGGRALRLRNGVILFLVLMGLKIDDPKIRRSVLTACSALSLTLLGYFFVYVVGPNDIKWWLDASLDRLLIQLWPSLVFLLFMVAKTPEELLQSHSLAEAGSLTGMPETMSSTREMISSTLSRAGDGNWMSGAKECPPFERRKAGGLKMALLTSLKRRDQKT